jgi:hypothetical protein
VLDSEYRSIVCISSDLFFPGICFLWCLGRRVEICSVFRLILRSNLIFKKIEFFFLHFFPLKIIVSFPFSSVLLIYFFRAFTTIKTSPKKQMLLLDSELLALRESDSIRVLVFCVEAWSDKLPFSTFV